MVAGRKGSEDKVDDKATSWHVQQGATEGHKIVQPIESQGVGGGQACLLPEGRC